VKRVGIRDFRDHATQYLAGDEVLAIERYGQPIGFFIPAGRTRLESFTQALERLEQSVQRALTETGMGEEELSRLFDLRQPLPDQPHADGSTVPAGSNASRR